MKLEEILSELPYLAGLPKEEVARLATVCRTFDVEAGTTVIEQGADPSDLLVIIEGNFKAVREGAAGNVVLGTSSVGQVLGEMSLLENQPTSAKVTAVTDGKLLRIPGSELDSITSSPEVVNRMLRTVTKRLREREAALLQSEKLAALGTLTAGLLHEVNNPAAALMRAGAELKEAADRLTPEIESPSLTALQRSDRTRAVASLLAESSIDPKLAGSLVAQGWDPERFRAIPANERQQTADLAHLRQLASEVVMAAGRLSELVGTVKRWTFHDQGTSNDVDLVTVIRDSLTLLRHKVGSLELRTVLPNSLQIQARGGELSQVLTNLIDNAIDAAKSTLTISLQSDDEQAVITVTDDGQGIPPDKIDRIWEPFFTTKPPGKGSGLGLAVSARLIADHGGLINVESRPGETRFVVRIPLRPRT
jgi:signal transduction histidine kinase